MRRPVSSNLNLNRLSIVLVVAKHHASRSLCLFYFYCFYSLNCVVDFFLICLIAQSRFRHRWDVSAEYRGTAAVLAGLLKLDFSEDE